MESVFLNILVVFFKYAQKNVPHMYHIHAILYNMKYYVVSSNKCKPYVAHFAVYAFILIC